MCGVGEREREKEKGGREMGGRGGLSTAHCLLLSTKRLNQKKKLVFSFINCLEMFGSSFVCYCPMNGVSEISL